MPILSIGLTGGIGSGKSTVAALLAGHGAFIVDVDAIAREITQPGGAAIPALTAEFGATAITAVGALDRAHMRQLAFSDPAARRRLEHILHPLIGEEASARAASAHGRPVVFDVPLLAESRHWRARVQRVLVVDCGADTQARRVAQRPGWNEDTARAVIAQQARREQRRAIADAVIHNEGIPLDALAAQVGALWALWTLPASGLPGGRVEQ